MQIKNFKQESTEVSFIVDHLGEENLVEIKLINDSEISRTDLNWYAENWLDSDYDKVIEFMNASIQFILPNGVKIEDVKQNLD